MWNKGSTLKHQNRDKTDCAIDNNIGNPNFRARAAGTVVPVAFAFFCFEEKMEVLRGH